MINNLVFIGQPIKLERIYFGIYSIQIIICRFKKKLKK